MNMKNQTMHLKHSQSIFNRLNEQFKHQKENVSSLIKDNSQFKQYKKVSQSKCDYRYDSDMVYKQIQDRILH